MLQATRIMLRIEQYSEHEALIGWKSINQSAASLTLAFAARFVSVSPSLAVAL